MMKTSLTKIGNSKGVLIPAKFLQACDFGDMVSMELKNDRIIISKASAPRAGWAENFAKANGDQEEKLFDDAMSNDFDEQEWQW